MAFGVLRSVFATQERGLRLRQGLDEALEGWDESDAEESEIERQVEESRRLMPY